MKSVLGSSKYAPSRLGMSQPGSPLTTYKAAAAAAATPWTSTGACNFSTLGTVGPRAVPPLTALQARTAATAPQPFTQSKHDRNSLGAVSNTSSTPAGLFISPGVAALANKYATSSVGGSSIGAMSLPDQLLTGEKLLAAYCCNTRGTAEISLHIHNCSPQNWCTCNVFTT